MSALPPHIHLVAADSVAPQPWRNGGGQTRELLAWPDAAHWRLRISRADIAASGPFSQFSGVQRWFVVLSGAGVELRMPTPDQHSQDIQLLPGHLPFAFDGGQAPDCRLLDGPTQDLNLMARGGASCMAPAIPGEPWAAGYTLCALYTTEGGRWQHAGHRLAVPANSLLWLERPRGQSTGATDPMYFAPDQPARAQNTPSLPATAWWMGFTPEDLSCPTA